MPRFPPLPASPWPQRLKWGSIKEEVGLSRDDNCTLLEIDQQLLGFHRFIGSWLYTGDINLIVDVGPANSAQSLIHTLIDLDIDRIDYVLLTHIHLDHAGGLSQFLEHFPMARVVCYDRGIKHLLEPSSLWEGSRKALGEIAEGYGPPEPVKEEFFVPHTETHIDGLQVIETPGHAIHHLSFTYRGNLFAGEAGGNYYSLKDTDYLRPATPPRFFMEVFVNSVDKLLALEDQHICYAHFGDATSSKQMLRRFRTQVLRWKDLIRGEVTVGSDALVERCVQRLLEKDLDLKAFSLMDTDTQAREKYFLSNSVKGYIGFLQKGNAILMDS